MTVRTTTDTGAILRRVEAALDSDPVRNTIYGSIRAGLERTDADGWCAHSGPALAARSRSVTPIAFTEGWTDLDRLAGAVAALPSVTGLGGPVPVVESVVERLGREPARNARERLFRLDELRNPIPVSGDARLAVDTDVTFLTEWYTAFAGEVLGRLPAGFDVRAEVERRVAMSRTWLWCDGYGAAVAMAMRHPTVHGVSRIGPVYTPSSSRGRGFGSAVTATATRDALDDGAVPVLYTDLANPTSNKIYQALGYRAVTDRAAVSFG